MRFCIVCAGAIGGFVGTKIALAGEEATFIARVFPLSEPYSSLRALHPEAAPAGTTGASAGRRVAAPGSHQAIAGRPG